MANTVKIVIDVDDKGSAKVRQFSSSLTSQVRQMSSGSLGHVRSLAEGFQNRLGGAIEKVKSSVLSLKTLAVTALAGWGVERLAAGFIETGAKMDQMKMSLDTITKGEGEAWFKKLNDWAMKMPINTEKAIQSFIMMRAMGLRPSIEDMTTLVDTTSALGGQEGTLEGIARALGQMQAKGRASAEELMQLSERGVPVFEILQEKLHMTGAQIQDIGSQSVSAGAVIKAVMEGLAERFGGQSERIQSRYSGMVEALKGYWTDFQKMVMESGVMRGIEAGLKRVMDKLDAMKADGSLQQWAENAAAAIVSMAKKTSLAAAGVYDWFAEHMPKIKDYLSGLWDAFNALPSWMQTGGLIGAFLGGKSGVVALGVMLHLIESLRNSAAGFGLVASGQLDFSRFSKMNAPELAAYLKEFNAQNPEVNVGVAPRLNMPSGLAGGAAESVRSFWAGFDTQMAAAQEKAKAGSQTVSEVAMGGLTTAQGITIETVRKQAEAVLKVAEADKKSLETRLQAWRQYYDQLQGLAEKNKEQQQKHIEELNALYRQQADVRRSADAQIRGLQEIGMTAEQRYQSQKSALLDQYTAAARLSGQEQIKALEEYKQALASFGSTWGKGVTETSENIIFGSRTSTIVSGKEVIASVVADIEAATTMQQQALQTLAAEKQAQIQQDQVWGETLKQSASEAEASIESLSGVIGELAAKIAEMQKAIEITAVDDASWRIDMISKALAELHDKTVYVTTIHRTVFEGGEAGGSAAPVPAPMAEYALGTDYVPRTGLYMLHQGEAVTPAAEVVRQRYEEAGNRDIVLRMIRENRSAYADDTGLRAAAGPDAARSMGAYALGTDYVPRTGLYMLHQGEAVTPAAEVVRQRSVIRGSSGASDGDTDAIIDRRAVGRIAIPAPMYVNAVPPVAPVVHKSDSRSVTIGDVHIHLPESVAAQRPEDWDWRAIARERIIPELRKANV